MTIKKLRKMKKLKLLISLGFLPLIFSCVDVRELIIPIPDDITFNELQLSPYTHVIPDNGFSSGGITFNTSKNSNGTYSGFAYSNQNNRSFVWSDSQAARDTNLYSVYTGGNRNMTEVFAVACANNEEETYFTLSEPTVIEHILVANTTYNYLAMNYGEKSNSIANPNIPSAPKAVWYTYAPGVTKTLGSLNSYYKIIANGYNGATLTGTVDIYLCTRRADPDNPTFSYIRTDWAKADLTALGAVTKVTFSTDCSYKDEFGNDLIHSWFCIDGIRLKK